MVDRDNKCHYSMGQLLPQVCGVRAAVAKVFVVYEVLTFR